MDPGWKPALKHTWRIFVPGYLARAAPAPTLAVLRGFWLSMPLQWALFASVLVFLQGESTDRPAWVLPFVAGAGSISLFLGAGILAPRIRLNTESMRSAATSFTQMSLIQWSMVSASVLYGFVGFFLGGGMPAYLLGLPLGAAGFFLLAPTERNIRRVQEQIRSTGSPISLYEALQLPFQPPTRRQKQKPPNSPPPAPPSGTAPG